MHGPLLYDNQKLASESTRSNQKGKRKIKSILDPIGGQPINRKKIYDSIFLRNIWKVGEEHRLYTNAGMAIIDEV